MGIGDHMSVIIKYNSQTTDNYLSNMFIEPDITHVEGEYQAHKHADPAFIQATITVLMAVHPTSAKRLGRSIRLRPDWDRVKDQIMYELVLQKFKDHPELRNRLLSTESKMLVHDCPWGDTYWGVCRGKGLNKHGEITMRVREEVRG